MHRNRNHAHQLNMLVPLLMAVGQHVQRLDFLPTVTLAVLAFNAYVFLQTVGRNLTPFCISAPKVLAGNYAVVLYNTFVHADQMHLYYNSLSFLHKGVQLERKFGALGLLWFIFLSSLLTPLFYILISVIMGPLFSPGCAVGFSGVIFALKVLCQHHFPSAALVMGITLPAWGVAWGELIAISLVTPNASFVGHLAGILAGLTIIYSPKVTGVLRGGGGRRT